MVTPSVALFFGGLSLPVGRHKGHRSAFPPRKPQEPKRSQKKIVSSSARKSPKATHYELKRGFGDNPRGAPGGGGAGVGGGGARGGGARGGGARRGGRGGGLRPTLTILI